MRSTTLLLVIAALALVGSSDAARFQKPARRYAYSSAQASATSSGTSSGTTGGGGGTPSTSSSTTTPSPPPAPLEPGSATVTQTFTIEFPSTVTTATYAGSAFQIVMNFVFGAMHAVVDETASPWVFFTGCSTTTSLSRRNNAIVATTIASPEKANAARDGANAARAFSVAELSTALSGKMTGAKSAAIAANPSLTAAINALPANVTATAQASEPNVQIATGAASAMHTFSAVAGLALAVVALRQ